MVLMANRKGHVTQPIILTCGITADRDDESPALSPCYKHKQTLGVKYRQKQRELKARRVSRY